MNAINYDNISLLIIGYDPYKDVWDHYFELLNKYWPDRPQTFLASNILMPNYENVTVIPCGEDAEWSKKVYTAIDAIPTDYVVLLLEDFFTTRPVNGDNFEDLVRIIEKNNVDFCKLLNQTKIKGKSYDGKPYLHILDENSDYGISLQPAIWKKNFLKDLVGSDNYNAWIFELNQVRNKTHLRSDVVALGDDRNILEITHTVVQCKYLRKSIKVFEKQGYHIDTGTRPVMTFSENLKYDLKCRVSELSPKCLRPILKKIGKLMNVDFVSDRMEKRNK